MGGGTEGGSAIWAGVGGAGVGTGEGGREFPSPPRSAPAGPGEDMAGLGGPPWASKPSSDMGAGLCRERMEPGGSRSGAGG